jgi:hypothetical protein
MIGNLYFVGTKPASCHLIDTGDGLILIDVGYVETADHVIESMKTLGFDVRDVKMIILSHGHYDHSDGVAKIKALSGATVYMSELDNKYLNTFKKPDVNLKDGDIITLGNTEILCRHTPGHTEGTFSFFWNVEEDGVTYRAAMFGGAPIANATLLYDFARSVLLLAVLGLGATPLPKRITAHLTEKHVAFQVIQLVLCLVVLVISTAYLVDSSYNPFLYFRF